MEPTEAAQRLAREYADAQATVSKVDAWRGWERIDESARPARIVAAQRLIDAGWTPPPEPDWQWEAAKAWCAGRHTEIATVCNVCNANARKLDPATARAVAEQLAADT